MTRVASHLRFTAFVVILTAILTVGWGNDRASCDRHNDSVSHINAMANYAVHAATARSDSAAHEAMIDPVQARIDRAAAQAFTKDAKGIRATPLACDGLLPATR